MRGSICSLLAAIAILTSCSTYFQSGTAQRFQDGIYYKASEAVVETDTVAVSTSLIPKTSSGGDLNIYVNPVGLSFGLAVAYPWASNLYWDNWYWDRWYRPWRHWDPWYRPWDPWYRPWDPWCRPWDPWYRRWDPWWPGPGPIYVRDPYAIRTTRSVRASGGGFTYRASGSAGSRFVGRVNAGSSSPSPSDRYGRSVGVGGTGSAETRSSVITTTVNKARQSTESRSYGRNVSGVDNSSARSYETRSNTNYNGSSSYRSSGGSSFSSGSSGGFQGGSSSRSGSAGFRR